MARTTKTTKTTTTRKPKAKVWPGKRGVGKGGTVTRHGVTTTGYQRGCRCRLCVQAASDYARAARERKAATAVKAAKPKATVKPKATPRRRRATKAKATS
jgi:hypothetical protein